MRKVIAFAAMVLALQTVTEACNAQSRQIVIATGGKSVAFMPLWVASRAGYFADEGYKAEITNLAGGALAVTAVAGKQAVMGWTGGPDAFNAAATGQPVRIVGLPLDQFATQITVTKKFLSGKDVSPASPLAQRVRALKGAKIAVTSPGSGTDQFIRLLLKQHDLDPDRDVEIVAIGADPGANISALEYGRVDASVLSPPTSYSADAAGSSVMLIDPLRGDVPLVAGITNHLIVAHKDVLQNEPELVEKLLYAVTRAMRLIRDKPEEAYKFLTQEYPEMNPGVLRASFEGMRQAVPASPLVSEQVVSNFLAFQKQVGGNSRIPEKLAYEDVVDPGPARKAAAR